MPGFALLPAVLTKNDFDTSPSMPSQFASAKPLSGESAAVGLMLGSPSLQSSALVTRPATATHDSTKSAPLPNPSVSTSANHRPQSKPSPKT